MYPREELPTQTRPEYGTLKRQHTARYYAHRVRESFSTRVSKLICAVFLSLLFTVGIITFILWLGLRPHRPRVYILDFSLPSLNQDNGFENAVISFKVTDRNPNQYMGIFYNRTEASVYYKDQSIGMTPLLFPFYQPPKTTTPINGQLGGATLTVNSDRWKEFMGDRETGTVAFRLELASTIRFKISTWNSKHHRMHASCAVSVDKDGAILSTSKDKRCPTYFS